MNVNDIPTAAETLYDRIKEKIRKAAEDPDCSVGNLEILIKQLAEVKQIKAQVAAIQNKLLSMNGSEEAQRKSDVAESLLIFQREVVIEVSQGMINQNLLTLTDALRNGQIKVGEDLTIEALPSGDKFTTIVMDTGNKLQERGAIGKFYRDAGVRAGDFAVLRETSRGQWQLLKRNSVERNKIIARRSGVVATEPRLDGGRVLFMLRRDDNGEMLSCMAAVDFEGGVPKAGVKLTLAGEHKTDLILGRTPFFVFSAIEY